MADEMTPTEPAVWDLASGLVEDVGKRSQNSKLFSASDGSQTSLMVSNLHYQPRPGEWEPQDLNFQVNGSYQEVGRHWFRTRVSDEGIEVLETANNIGIQWEFSGLNVDGHCAGCSTGGVEWSYEVGPRRLKLSGTVRTPQGLRTYSFPYQPLGDASDFTIIDGNAVADGLSVAAPFIIGNNEQQYIIPSGWVLQSSRLTFTFDDSILPPGAYPYIIDPTTTLIETGVSTPDLVIADYNPDTNHAAGGELTAGDNNSGGAQTQRSLIKFVMTSITAPVAVSSAVLSLYEKAAADNNSLSPFAIVFNRIRRDWVESQATYNSWKTGSAWSTAGCSHTDDDYVSTVSDTLNFDATAASAYVAWPSSSQMIADVEGFINGSINNYGWRMSAPTAEQQSSNTIVKFYDSENGTEARRPKLVVVHALPFTPRAIMF